MPAKREGSLLSWVAVNIRFRMSDKILSDCVHEAGHAVLRYLRGDTILSIRVEIVGPSEAKMSRPGSRGCTNSKSKERECPVCKGYVRNYPPETDPTGTRSSISLNKDCKECVDLIVTRLSAVYAGARATKILTPAFHDQRDAQYDEVDIADLFRQLPFPQAQRRSIINRAKALAINTVMRERKAINALAESLKVAGGFLGGEEASKIIRENLVNFELQPN
jgi:hypothetical protein